MMASCLAWVSLQFCYSNFTTCANYSDAHKCMTSDNREDVKRLNYKNCKKYEHINIVNIQCSITLHNGVLASED